MADSFKPGLSLNCLNSPVVGEQFHHDPPGRAVVLDAGVPAV
jgi:hypothetical protein